MCSLDIAELRCAFGVVSGALFVAIEWVDAVWRMSRPGR